MADAAPDPNDFKLEPDPIQDKEGGKVVDPAPPKPRQTIIPPEVADKLPPQIRETLEFGMTMMGPMPNPLAQHVTPEHITKILDNQEKASERENALETAELGDRKHNRLTACVVGIVVLIVTGVIWGVLPKDRLESFNEIARTAIALAVGGVGGYGWALKNESENRS